MTIKLDKVNLKHHRYEDGGGGYFHTFRNVYIYGRYVTVNENRLWRRPNPKLPLREGPLTPLTTA